MIAPTHVNGLDNLSVNNDNAVGWVPTAPAPPSSLLSSSTSKMVVSTCSSSKTATLTTTAAGGKEQLQNISITPNEQYQERSKQSFFFNKRREEEGVNNNIFQVSVPFPILEQQQKCDDLVIPRSFFHLFDSNKNKIELSLRNLLPIVSSSSTSGKTIQQSVTDHTSTNALACNTISNSDRSCRNRVSSFSSSLDEDILDGIYHGNDNDSLNDESVTSNIFDDGLDLVDLSPKFKCSSSSRTVRGNIDSNKSTDLIGDGEDDFNRNEDTIDVLDSVSMVLHRSTKDDFSGNNNNNTATTNYSVDIYHQELLSKYHMLLSSALLLEPTPISMEPGRIRVIPKTNSSPKARRKEGSPSHLDHHHQQQNSSSRGFNQGEKHNKEGTLAGQTTMKEDSLSFQQAHCSSVATKSRPIPAELEWSKMHEDDEEEKDSFSIGDKTIDLHGNITTIRDATTACSKLKRTTSGNISAQPARKKSRSSDNDSNIAPKCDNNDQDDDSITTNGNNNKQFRTYQAEQWWQRLQDMIDYQKVYGHCNVPNTFPKNPVLAQWVKRQRYQYKLKQEGKHSTLTDERESILENLGFIWDSHGALWAERWNELKAFYDKFGHSNVLSDYSKNRQLAIWVKCQRRQYKLYEAGDAKSNMTVDRIRKLEMLDFIWHPKVGAKSAKEKELYKNIM